jgi:hypothetical protein
MEFCNQRRLHPYQPSVSAKKSLDLQLQDGTRSGGAMKSQPRAAWSVTPEMKAGVGWILPYCKTRGSPFPMEIALHYVTKIECKSSNSAEFVEISTINYTALRT